MYCIKNIEQFLSQGGQGGALNSDVKAGILERAKEVANNNGGMIMGGNTKDIIGDEQIEDLFENALGSDMNQLAILAELAQAAAVAGLIQKFSQRKEDNGKKQRINNDALVAGSPMYYYCGHCGAEDVKPENFDPRTNPIKNPCDECRVLIEKGLMPKD